MFVSADMTQPCYVTIFTVFLRRVTLHFEQDIEETFKTCVSQKESNCRSLKREKSVKYLEEPSQHMLTKRWFSNGVAAEIALWEFIGLHRRRPVIG